MQSMTPQSFCISLWIALRINALMSLGSESQRRSIGSVHSLKIWRILNVDSGSPEEHVPPLQKNIYSFRCIGVILVVVLQHHGQHLQWPFQT